MTKEFDLQASGIHLRSHTMGSWCRVYLVEGADERLLGADVYHNVVQRLRRAFSGRTSFPRSGGEPLGTELKHVLMLAEVHTAFLVRRVSADTDADFELVLRDADRHGTPEIVRVMLTAETCNHWAASLNQDS